MPSIAPGQPVPPQEQIFTLNCIERAPHITTKNFRYSGDMKGAIGRAREYCEKMNIKFVFVRPFITDLDEDEKRRAEI